MNPVNSTATATIELPNKAYMLPESIPMWPPAWWTWLVVGTLLLLLIIFISYKIIRYKNNAYRRDAFKLIQDLHQADDLEALSQCHQIIRRCLITQGRSDLASLPNQALFDELDLGIAPKYQFKQLGDVFIKGPYQANTVLTSEQKSDMIKLTQHWCRRHKIHA